MTRTRRSVALATLAIMTLLAAAVVIGGVVDLSKASFSDSERIGPNHLGAATLDIEPGENTTGVRVTNMAPGDSAATTITLVNVGELPLRYALMSQTEPSPLNEWLSTAVWEGTSCTDGAPDSDPLASPISLADANSTALVGDPATGLQPGDRQLAPGEQETFCMVFELDSAAPNDVQGTETHQVISAHAEHDI